MQIPQLTAHSCPSSPLPVPHPLPQLLLSPLWSLWLGLGEFLQCLRARQRDRACCGQCPGPSSEAGFTSNLPNVGRTSSPQKVACSPSPLRPRSGREKGRQGQERAGLAEQGGNPRVLGGDRDFGVWLCMCECILKPTTNGKKTTGQLKGPLGSRTCWSAHATRTHTHTHTRIHPSQPHMPHTYHALTLRGLPTRARVLPTGFWIHSLSCPLLSRSPLARLPGRRHPGPPWLPRAIYQM